MRLFIASPVIINDYQSIKQDFQGTIEWQMGGGGEPASDLGSKPHITLCRIKQIDDYRAYKEVLKSYTENPLGKIIPEIALCQSDLGRDGAHYTGLQLSILL